MINENVKARLIYKGYKDVKVNIDNVNIYYKLQDEYAYIVLLLKMDTGQEFTEEQYINIIRQVKNSFIAKGQGVGKVLGILFTEKINEIKSFCKDQDNHWILDTKRKQLIIYENQDATFLTLRQDLEDILETIRKADFKDAEIKQLSIVNQERTYSKTNIRQYLTPCNIIVIIINILIFIYIEVHASTENTEDMISFGAMYWPYVIEKGEYYRLITSTFLHFGLGHIFNNMLILLFMGSYMERLLGTVKYLSVYFSSGIVASLVSMYYNMSQGNLVVSAGASGAIFGISGAMLSIVLINKGRIKDIHINQIAFFVIVTLYHGLTSQGTDNAAHIGGLVMGVFMGALVSFTNKFNE